MPPRLDFIPLLSDSDLLKNIAVESHKLQILPLCASRRNEIETELEACLAEAKRRVAIALQLEKDQ